MRSRKGIRLLALLACLSIGMMTAACGVQEPPVSEPDSSVPVATEDEVTTTTTTETTEPSETATATAASTTAQKTTAVQKKTTAGKTTVTTTTAATTTKVVEYPSAAKKSSVGFGFYGVAPDGGWTTTFDDMVESDWCNTFLVGPSELEEALQKAKVHHSQVFVSVGGYLWRFTGGAKLIDRWQEDTDKLIKIAKDSGAYDAFAGFYMDEPMLCGITHEDFLKATKYMREATNNEKRVFICFSIAGIAPEQWTTESASPPISPETGKYITDTAFDIYGSWTKDSKKNFEELTEKMLTRLGNRSDLRVWYVPPVMNYGGKSKEQNSIDFVDGLVELLKEQKNPGGILGYSWQVALSETDTLGNIGLGDMLNSSRKDPWTKLYDHLKEVGRDICSGKTYAEINQIK